MSASVLMLRSKLCAVGRHAVPGAQMGTMANVVDSFAKVDSKWLPPQRLRAVARAACSNAEREDFDGTIVDMALIRFVEQHHPDRQLRWAPANKLYQSVEGPRVPIVYAFDGDTLVAMVAPLASSRNRVRPTLYKIGGPSN